jgi:hypothetical protein
LPPKAIAEDALAAQTGTLDKLGQLPGPELDDLRELGSLEQTAAAMLG